MHKILLSTPPGQATQTVQAIYDPSGQQSPAYAGSFVEVAQEDVMEFASWRGIRHNRKDFCVVIVDRAVPDAVVFIERLRYAAKFEIAMPILVSSMTADFPYCGVIWPYDAHTSKKRLDAGERNPYTIDSFAHRTEPTTVEVTYDFNRVRLLLQDKFKFKEVCGTWPPDEIFALTMFAKIYRIEAKKMKFLTQVEAFGDAFC